MTTRLRKPCSHDWYQEHWYESDDGTYPMHCVGGVEPTANELIDALLAVRYVGHYLALDNIPNHRLADELRSRGYEVPSTYLDAFGCLPWEKGDIPSEVAVRRMRDAE